MADKADDVKAAEEAAPVPSTEDKKPEADPVLETLASDDDKPSETKPNEEESKPEPETDKPEEPTEKEEEPKAEETKEEKPPTKADERKSQLNTEIRDLVAQRNALKEEVSKATEQVYQPATEAELVDDGMSATDAKVEALRQQIEIKDYNEKVTEAQLTVESESNRVLTDFDWANPNKPEYKEELSLEAAKLLDANLIRDPNVPELDLQTGQPTGKGIVIGSNISPYQLYKTLDRASGISTVEGQIKGQQATEAMLANADGAGTASPPKQTKDPVLEILSSDDY